MSFKQVVLVRNDLKLPKGKMAAQVAHACVDAVLLSLKRDSDIVKKWRNEGMKKIILKVEDEKELILYFQKAKDSGLVTALITDAGRTVVEPGTKTCIAIGPNKEEEIDLLTKDLKMI
jgi:peptidyl-tRNA hydrolase, PTH2 family